MGKDHLKRIVTPKTWSILRKDKVFVTRPKPGKSMELSLPLGFILKEVIGVCSTTKQVKALLINGEIKVANKIRRDNRYPVGLYEIVELVSQKEMYRLIIGKNGKLTVQKIDAKENGKRLFKIVSKTKVRDKKTQLNLLNGGVVLVEKDTYKVGDSIILDEKGAIVTHVAFKPGVAVQFIGGRHIGAQGTLDSIDDQKIVVQLDGKPVETLKKYAFVIGEKKAEITVSDNE